MSADDWQRGLTLTTYVDGMQRHQDATRRRLAQIVLRLEDEQALARLTGRPHVLVMTEDWCGDSMLTLPILAHLLAAAPASDLRVFPRSLWPQLEAYYREQGVTHIPVFSFLTADFGDPLTWVERPQLAHARLADWYAAHPAVTAVRNDASLDPDLRRQRLRELTAGLLDEMEAWYDTGGAQPAMIAELKHLLML